MAANDAALESDLLNRNVDLWPNFHGYKPLDRLRKEIRLLRILRNNEEAVMVCQLVHRSLEDEIQYSALSYYWGAAGNSSTIIVDDKKVIIRETLHGFLRRLSSRFGPILLWLDCICINQSDTSERNWQVSLMQDIYESAQRVYAWLGEGDADCLFAMRYARLKNHGLPILPIVHPRLLTQYFEQLFLQPYWSRVWVIQEAVLAKQLWLLCGDEMTLWDSLMLAFDHLLDNREKLPFPHGASRKADFWDETETEEDTEACSRFLRFKRARCSFVNDDKNSLLELAELFQRQNCTDPRDKFYGLRAIASNGKFLNVDYSHSTPQVFFEALDLNIPVIERLGPTSLSLGWGKLDYALLLCSSIPMSEVDIITILQGTASHSMLEWLTYGGEVLSSRPIEPPRYSNQRQFWKIMVHIETKADEERYYYSTSPDVQPGDRLYALSSPGEGDEESNELLKQFVVAFRKVAAHSKAIDRLITPSQMDHLVNFRKTTVDSLLHEYDALRCACIGRIELCSANTPALPSLQRSPGIILAHVSYATMFTLIAWFKCRRIPEYINRFNNHQRENPGNNSTSLIRLCECPDNAIIEVNRRSGNEVFSASWSLVNGVDMVRTT